MLEGWSKRKENFNILDLLVIKAKIVSFKGLLQHPQDFT
jgi:hypothetical protein